MKQDNQVLKLAELGVPNFEASDKVEQSQRRLLKWLRGTSIHRQKYANLALCGPDTCGRDPCSEACLYATWRRRLRMIPAAHELLTGRGRPIYEVQVVRGCWAKPIGDLSKVNIATAKKLNSRTLDKIMHPDLVAVGMHKIMFCGQERWVPMIHQLVVGADEDDLEQAFELGRRNRLGDRFRITPVENVGDALNRVLKRNMPRNADQEHRSPSDNPDGGGWPTYTPGIEHSALTMERNHRAEMYVWLLSLSINERLIRYGCDRHLNKLTKKPKVIRLRKRRRRPYPKHLVPFMFGSHPFQCNCRICQNL